MGTDFCCVEDFECNSSSLNKCIECVEFELNGKSLQPLHTRKMILS